MLATPLLDCRVSEVGRDYSVLAATGELSSR